MSILPTIGEEAQKLYYINNLILRHQAATAQLVHHLGYAD